MAKLPRINIYEITKGACRRLPAPCPHDLCRFNLTAEYRERRGSKAAEPPPPIVGEACALEAAENGGMTLQEVATRLSLTRERVRQIEEKALWKLWFRLGIQDGPRLKEHRQHLNRRDQASASSSTLHE
jgi:hypothetical protein